MKSLLKIPLLVAVATMMTCSFSACSDNDDPTPDTGTSETDAKFKAIAKQYLDHTVYVTYKTRPSAVPEGKRIIGKSITSCRKKPVDMYPRLSPPTM